MGHVRDKYTADYALCQKDGKRVGIGIRGVECWERGDLRNDQKAMLQQINFKNKSVLCIGCGRGEEVRFIDNAGAKRITAIDFSEPIYKIAKDYLADTEAELLCEDFIVFCQGLTNEVYDYIIMIEVAEHIPRDELRMGLALLRPHISNKGLLFFSMPFYPVDNDLIKEGYNPAAPDSSDKHEETSGMHCNRYTRQSFTMFMNECGFRDVSAPKLIAFVKDKNHA